MENKYKYYAFGTGLVDVIDSTYLTTDPIESILKSLKEDNFEDLTDGEIFIYDESINNPSDILDVFKGYDYYIAINEETYWVLSLLKARANLEYWEGIVRNGGTVPVGSEGSLESDIKNATDRLKSLEFDMNKIYGLFTPPPPEPEELRKKEESATSWSFVEKYYPNYSKCDTIAEESSLDRIHNELEEVRADPESSAYDVLSDYSQEDLDNNLPKMDMLDLRCDIYAAAIKAFQDRDEARSISVHSSIIMHYFEEYLNKFQNGIFAFFHKVADIAIEFEEQYPNGITNWENIDEGYEDTLIEFTEKRLK